MNRALILAGVAAVAVAGLYVWRRGGVAPAAEAAGRAVVGAASGVFSGAVKGAGSMVGIPDTAPDKCSAALVAGDMWAASFACPAGTFLGAAWNKATGSAPPPVDGTILDRWDYAARNGSSSNGQATDASFDDLSDPEQWMFPEPSLGYAP